MLFQEIPSDFKNTMDTYFKTLFSNIEKKTKNISSLNNLLFMSNIRTDHLNLEIGCSKHIQVMTELFFLLHIFHRFTQVNNILYSISSGNLLGHFSNCDILPWDDDIDIIVTTAHFSKIKNLWNKSIQSYNIWDHNWEYKPIYMDSYPIILLKRKGNDFFKIMLNIDKIKTRGQYQADIGGIDICTINWTCSGGQSKPFSKDIVNTITKNEEEKYYPIIKYGPIETRRFNNELSLILLNAMYPRWKEMKHPNLF
jgi:hypothetical protein